MKKVFVPVMAALAIGFVACSEDSDPVSATSTESLYNTSISVDKKNQVLTYTSVPKGICLLDNFSINWNANPLTTSMAYKYEISSDTLYLFRRYLDNNTTSTEGSVYVGGKNLFSTWNDANCKVLIDSLGAYHQMCYGAENYAYTHQLKFSKSSVIEDVVMNSDYNYAYSEFIRDLFGVLENKFTLDNVFRRNLFVSLDKNVEDFKKINETFTIKNNRKVDFSYGTQSFTVSVDTAFYGYPSLNASVQVASNGSTCSYQYLESAMQKKLCNNKHAPGFVVSTYTDADRVDHQIAEVYLSDNRDEFVKCLRELVKDNETLNKTPETPKPEIPVSPVAKDSTESPDEKVSTPVAAAKAAYSANETHLKSVGAILFGGF